MNKQQQIFTIIELIYKQNTSAKNKPDYYKIEELLWYYENTAHLAIDRYEALNALWEKDWEDTIWAVFSKQIEVENTSKLEIEDKTHKVKENTQGKISKKNDVDNKEESSIQDKESKEKSAKPSEPYLLVPPRVFKERKLGDVWKSIYTNKKYRHLSLYAIESIIQYYCDTRIWKPIYEESNQHQIAIFLLVDQNHSNAAFQRIYKEIEASIQRSPYILLTIIEFSPQDIPDKAKINEWQHKINQIPVDFTRSLILLLTDGTHRKWLEAQHFFNRMANNHELIWLCPYPYYLYDKTILGFLLQEINEKDTISKTNSMGLFFCDDRGIPSIGSKQKNYTCYSYCPPQSEVIQAIEKNTNKRQNITEWAEEVIFRLNPCAYQLLCICAYLTKFDADLLHLLRLNFIKHASRYQEAEVYTSGLIGYNQHLQYFYVEEEARTILSTSKYFLQQIGEQLPQAYKFVKKYAEEKATYTMSNPWKTPFNRQQIRELFPEEYIFLAENLLDVTGEYEENKTSKDVLEIITKAKREQATKLNLSEKDLKEIPKEIAELKNLSTLDLSSNQISQIPKEIAELKNLSTLDLSSNQISQIPKEIAELKNLSTLDLSSNQISKIPKEIAELKNLSKLYLDSNQISKIPKEIVELKNLSTLHLDSNQISKIPKEIAELKNLSTLHLDSNQISKIPKEIAKLKNLSTLDLSSNQISQIPKEIAELKNLSTLYLSSNQISQIPKEIAQLKNLSRLYLSSNQISQIPKEIAELNNLSTLYLSSNQISQIPKEMAELKNLSRLYLSSNQISQIPKEMLQLDKLKNIPDYNEIEVEGVKYKGNQLFLTNNKFDIPEEVYTKKPLEQMHYAWEWQVVEKFQKGNIEHAKNVEELFSDIASRLERDKKIDEVWTDLHQKLFTLQMKLLVRLYSKGWYGPQFKRPRIGDIGYDWLTDCLVWDLSGIVSHEMIPEHAKMLFPLSGNVNSNEWLEKISKYTFPGDPLDNDKQPFAEGTKNYLRMVEMSWELVQKIDFSPEIIQQSPLFFPAWLIQQICKGNRPDIQIFLEKHYSFSLARYSYYNSWEEYLIYLTEKHAGQYLTEIATYLLQELIIGQTNNYARSIISIVRKQRKDYPKFLNFLERYAQIHECENIPCSATPIRREYSGAYMLKDGWYTWLLDRVIESTEAKKEFAEYIENPQQEERDDKIYTPMEKKYWLAILDAFPTFWLATRSFWKYEPNMALEETIARFNNNKTHSETQDFVDEVTSEKLRELLDYLKEYKSKTKEPFPEWYQQWFFRRRRENPDICDSYYDVFVSA